MEGEMRRYLVGMMLAAVVHTTAAAQAGRVIGRVTDGVGNPVTAAEVALVARDSASAAARMETTGETGGFEFARVQPGAYTLRVRRAGFRAREMQVELRPGGRETLIARLPTAPRRERLAEERAPTERRPRR
jgi:protocatechuate 3,4-dioxygenase beta subunit